MRRAPRRGLWVTLLSTMGVSAACSSVAPKDKFLGCQSNDDCAGADFVCSIDQNRCVLAIEPPFGSLAFDLNDTVDQFRIEYRACDMEIQEEFDDVEKVFRFLSADEVGPRFPVEVTSTSALTSCVTCPETYTCDEDFRCVGPLASRLELRQNSRLGLPPLRSESQDFPVLDMEGVALPETPVEFRWPRYQENNPGADIPIVLEVDLPLEGDSNAKATMRRLVSPELGGADEPIEVVNTFQCQRGMFATPRIFETVDPIPETQVTFRYAEPVATPSTVLGIPRDDLPVCDDDEDCSSGWACDLDFGTCGLDLRGVTVAQTVTAELPDGTFTAWVYIYCEDGPPESRTFDIELAPGADTGLPRVQLQVTQPFAIPLPGDLPPVKLGGTSDICLPPWQPPQSVRFEFGADPLLLLETEQFEYRCCSVDCLPDPDAVMPVEPPPDQVCQSFTSATFSTPAMAPDPVAWAADGCLPLLEDENGQVGRYERTVDFGSCTEPGVCEVDLSPGEGLVPQTYTVALIQPPLSVFRSQSIELTITGETTSLDEPIAFEPRVILSGAVGCGESGCNPANATVMLERLRVSDEEEALAPFFYEARTITSGAFTAAVDPGVYVVTALPALGTGSGPAEFRVLDLRLGSSEVQMEGGIPRASLGEALELEEGVSVRMDLGEFPSSTTVTPLDIGSWKGLEGPDDVGEVDLNDPATCFNTNPRRACVSRRLRNSPLSPVLSGQADFTSREGSGSCE